MTPWIEINGRLVGSGFSVYIVAELSANHNQKFDSAVELVRAAKRAGADAIKLQTFMPGTITINCNNEYFRIGKGTAWAGKTLFKLYSEAYMPWEWQLKLKPIARDLGLDFFSSAFDPTSVDFLEKVGVSAHKVASFEIVDIPLIEKMARIAKPLIISTGMATLGEIGEAVQAARDVGATKIALLKCTSAYPAPPEEANLRTIPHLMEAFAVPVGLSDHTMGTTVPIAAAALGACIIEKHLTLSRSMPGPDSTFSLEPDEFKAMVQAIRTVEKVLGKVHYGPTKAEKKTKIFRRSLFVVQNLKKGEMFTNENVRSIRPGHGLAPKHLKDILGKKSKRSIKRGTPLSREMIEN
jgi:pseudaminic acid synthase